MSIEIRAYANGAGHALLWEGRMIASAVATEGGGCIVNLNGDATAHAGEAKAALLEAAYQRSIRDLDEAEEYLERAMLLANALRLLREE